MSEYKNGDRVRVVIESTLTGQELGWVLTDRGRYNVGHFGVTEIEVIPAPFVLPAKRWAQVVDDLGILWTRKSLDGFGPYEWYNLAGVGNISRDLLARKGLRVISEGISDE
jgi:hypothetical protein